MESNRDSMVIYRSFFEAIKDLPKETQADVWNAIFEFGLNFNEIELTGIASSFFKLIKPQLSANIKKFNNGMLPKGKKEANGNQEISKSEANDKQTISKSEGNVNVNVNDNVNDNVNGKINLKEFFKINKIAIEILPSEFITKNFGIKLDYLTSQYNLKDSIEILKSFETKCIGTEFADNNHFVNTLTKFFELNHLQFKPKTPRINILPR